MDKPSVSEQIEALWNHCQGLCDHLEALGHQYEVLSSRLESLELTALSGIDGSSGNNHALTAEQLKRSQEQQAESSSDEEDQYEDEPHPDDGYYPDPDDYDSNEGCYSDTRSSYTSHLSDDDVFCEDDFS